MNQHYLVGLASCALVLTACGGGGGGGDVTPSTSLPASASLVGTVPGTRIEAFGDNGSYYAVSSTNDGTGEHPFSLELPPGMGFRIVMITNEGTDEQLVTPIAFRDATGKVHNRLAVGAGERIDLGYVPLRMSRNEAAAEDLDDDGVLDEPMVLDDVGAKNPLLQSDADDDELDDYNDPDHGGYHYDDDTADPQDHDDDGVPNVYDDDHVAAENDSDGDGLPDSVDANRYNQEGHDNNDLEDDCDGDGYLDEDQDHDGFYDDDEDRDGYHDDDLDHDGRHDDDEDEGADEDERSCSAGPTPSPEPAPSTDPSPTPDPVATPDPAPTPAPAALDGEALYNSNCAACHSNPALFAGSSAAAISAAISAVPSMNSLSTLSAEEIQAIADYLGTL